MAEAPVITPQEMGMPSNVRELNTEGASVTIDYSHANDIGHFGGQEIARIALGGISEEEVAEGGQAYPRQEVAVIKINNPEDRAYKRYRDLWTVQRGGNRGIDPSADLMLVTIDVGGPRNVAFIKAGMAGYVLGREGQVPWVQDSVDPTPEGYQPFADNPSISRRQVSIYASPTGPLVRLQRHLVGDPETAPTTTVESDFFNQRPTSRL